MRVLRSLVVTTLLSAGPAFSSGSRGVSTRWLSGGATSGGGEDDLTSKFTKLDEKVSYNGKYRQIKSLKIKFPNERVVDFDILTQGGCGSVTVFAFNTTSRTATLIREYHPGSGHVQYGTVAGMLELGSKHSTPLACAQMELEEEAHLRADKWVPLLAEGVAQPFEKYSDNHFYPFLALDPVLVENPLPQDSEEFIWIVRDVSYSRMMELIYTGKINLVSTACILMAFKKLDELGIPYK